MGKYFNRYPLVDYGGQVAKNIMIRTDFTPETEADLNSKFDFSISDELQRPDNLSQSYYDNPYYDWVIYMANDIVDPYHDYYRSSSDLNKFIAAKYGSVANAQNQVLYYRNDWAATSGDQLSKSVYNNLDESIKKYYKPIIDNTNNIVAYERIEEDWTKSTNKIQELTVSNTTPLDRKSTRLNSSHSQQSRMPSSA